MDAEQLRTFVTVAREGSFRRAARLLHLAQSSASMRIRSLEKELGTELFQRDRQQGLVLTGCGRGFLPYAEQALAILDAGCEKLRGLGSSTRQLAVGASSIFIAYALPHAVRMFMEEYPDVGITLHSGSSTVVHRWLKERRIQLGLVTSPPGDVRAEPIFLDAIILVAAPHHPIAARGPLRLQELSDQVVIAFDKPNTFWDRVQLLLAEGEVRPAQTIQLDHIEPIKQMVQTGVGVSFLPRLAVREALERGRLVEIPLQGPRRLTQVTSAIYTSQADGRLIQMFLQILRQSLEALR